MKVYDLHEPWDDVSYSDVTNVQLPVPLADERIKRPFRVSLSQ
jgi:hypothetical protein